MPHVRHYRSVLIVLLLGVPLLILGTATAAPTPAPSGSTIVEVTGSAEDGFGIHRLDGSVTYPPTDSEALAECGEYDTLRARVRCRTQVRTWYADLAELQRTITHYRGLLD